MPGTSHHAGLSKRSHAQKLKQPAISATAAITYARTDLIVPLSLRVVPADTSPTVKFAPASSD
jgi:hypothetical protein